MQIDELTKDFIANKHKHVNYSRSHGFLPVIVGRLVKKSHLYNFGSTQDSGINEQWPFKFQFVLQDETGTVEAIAWYRMCPTLYMSLEVGNVVALRGFRCKPVYKPPEAPAPDEERQRIYEGADNDYFAAEKESLPQGVMEIAINGGINIRHITGPVLDSDILSGLPGLPIDVKSAAEIALLPDGALCDVCGVIAFLGEPVLSSYMTMSRWVLLRTSEAANSELWVKLYTHSNAPIFESLAVGITIAVTNLKTQHVVFTSTQRLVC